MYLEEKVLSAVRLSFRWIIILSDQLVAGLYTDKFRLV